MLGKEVFLGCVEYLSLFVGWEERVSDRDWVGKISWKENLNRVMGMIGIKKKIED